MLVGVAHCPVEQLLLSSLTSTSDGCVIGTATVTTLALLFACWLSVAREFSLSEVFAVLAVGITCRPAAKSWAEEGFPPKLW